jgi:HAD superfamily hydrolase (TIGR01509 family)
MNPTRNLTTLFIIEAVAYCKINGSPITVGGYRVGEIRPVWADGKPEIFQGSIRRAADDTVGASTSKVHMITDFGELRDAEPSFKMTMPPLPTIVVFDIGNVLLHWDPRLLYRKIFSNEAKTEWFLKEVCSPSFNLELDSGRPLHEAFADLSARFPDYADEIRAYDERWLETIAGPIAGSVEVLEALRRNGVRNYAITNFSVEKFGIARAAFSFLDAFDGIVVSGEERIVKPDPAIYRLLLDRYGLSAAACLFIDDSLKNVLGARAVGMHTHHFESVDGLRSALSRHGFSI